MRRVWNPNQQVTPLTPPVSCVATPPGFRCTTGPSAASPTCPLGHAVRLVALGRSAA